MAETSSASPFAWASYFDRLRREPVTLQLYSSWSAGLRILPDYDLLSDAKIPPATPNIIDVRVVRQKSRQLILRKVNILAIKLGGSLPPSARSGCRSVHVLICSRRESNPHSSVPKAIPDIEGFKFWFWSNENDEPIHIHVFKGGAAAKFWIQSEIRLGWNKGFKIAQLRRILRILEEQQDAIQEAWKNHFHG